MLERSASEDQIARLRLIRSDNIGPVTYFQLLARFGSAGAALDAIPDLAARGGGRAPKLVARGVVEREMEAVAALGARYLFLGQGLYPPLLAELETAPPALIVKGHLSLLEKPAIAMVGARNASAAACRFARQLARQVGEAGAVIVSGLARGIDTAAHDGALESGTIAVIAGGIDIFYPPENEDRQRAIAERGLLIAEQPPGVEPRAQGCNQLIREGATLIQNAEDVLETIRPFALRPLAQKGLDYRAPAASPDTSEAERRIVADLLSPTPVSVDEIIRQSGLPPAAVQTVLLELELAGRLERHAGGRVSLA